MSNSPVANTIKYLKACRADRDAGMQVSYTNDPAWLVTMAINRRAGWPDDPTHTRGSAMPVNGKYPKKAEGDTFRHLRLLSRQINSRSVVRPAECGEWKKLLLAKMPERFTCPEDEQ